MSGAQLAPALATGVEAVVSSPLGASLRAYVAADVASGGAPCWELRVQLGIGPQSMERGLKSENGRMACIPCPLVRMTISADWSPLS
jgi:hypothetical protein